MANFGQMAAYIAKRLIDPSGVAVSYDDIKEAINDAIRYWKFRRFWFNEVVDTATLTTQNGTIPLPALFLVPVTGDDGFYIEYGNIRYPLSKISQQVYDGILLSNGFGLPRWYTKDANLQYQCYPLPDQNYVVGRHYLKDYADLTTDAATNDFTTYASRLINLWTLGNLVTELRQDMDMGSYYRDASQNEYRQLRVLTDKENATGKLTLYSDLIN